MPEKPGRNSARNPLRSLSGYSDWSRCGCGPDCGLSRRAKGRTCSPLRRRGRHRLCGLPRSPADREVRCDLHMVVGRGGTTILPPTPRPPGRLLRGPCRHAARHDEAHNDRYIDVSIEPNNDASVFPNNVWNNFANNSRYNAACGCVRSLRRSPPVSYRRVGRRSSGHG